MMIQDTIEMGEKLSAAVAANDEAKAKEILIEYGKGLGIDMALHVTGLGAIKGIGNVVEHLEKNGGAKAVISELKRISDSLTSAKNYKRDGETNLTSQSDATLLNPKSSNARVFLREDLARQAGIPRNINEVWGASLEDLRKSFEMDNVKLTYFKKADSDAESYILTGHPDVKSVVVHPGGGVHSGKYYKFEMNDGSKIKIIDPSTYNPRTIQENTTFYNQTGQKIIHENYTWVIK
ncbi:MAG: hypothetical protein EOP48_28635 [Sphingobacteriales bacterium]|nr:MAG: hypothetical protein EOP48_28635 [Sphingobacteriales bacterium]